MQQLNLAIDYLVGFPTSGPSGKEKATREKALALEKFSGTFRLHAPSRLLNFPALKGLSALYFELAYSFTLLISKGTRPDKIIARTHFGFFLIVIAKMLKIPLIFEVHADPVEEAKIVTRSHLKQAVLVILGYWNVFSCRLVDGLIFNHPTLLAHYRNHYHITTPSIFSYNGANAKDIEICLSASAAREKVGLEPDRTILVFSGSLSPWHGIDYLLDLFPFIKTNKVDLLIVGGKDKSEGDSNQDIILENGNRILFTGRVSTEKAHLYNLASDICLLPVKNIRISPGSPLKLYDYAAAGKPIIAQADTLGYSDIIQAHDLGTTCDFTIPDRAGFCIDQFIATYSPTFYKAHNRAKAEGVLSWDTVISDWIRFIQQV